MTFSHRAIPIALAAVLIDAIGFGIVLPVLPSLIVELTGQTLPEATRIGGWLIIVFAVAHFFAGPILGNLGDRYGRRPVILAAMLIFAIDYALMAFAPTIAWLFAGRLIAGIAGAVYGPANAIIADVTPPDKRGATFGLMGAAFGIGFIIGPAIGGLLGEFGPRTPFMVAGALAALNATWIFFVLPETLAPENRRKFEWKRANPLGTFGPLFAMKGALPLLVVAFIWQLAHQVYPATWAFYAELAHGWDSRAIGWSLAASGTAMALTQIFVTGRAIAALGETKTLMIGLIVGTLAYAAYAFATEGWQVYVILMFGALQMLAYPSLNAMLSRRVDASNQGALQGGMASIASVAAILGPLSLTQTLAYGAEHGFAGAAFALAAALTLVAVGIVLVFLLRRGGEPAPVA
ncbi:TCR/Tet family MFS transporter [Sphingomonas sp. J315]|uniref:TCR/Tet family MFS transporter n=1 Tax=Sphingomonas sp. J315 TaxID=2898433 RepID=UPI0021ADDFAD|nr:TCR/Tet family MFS transporter [Sphingomonas sp. J315]UUX98636.1 TCR/Tet family MFS transporter [Sphingomonas sp. J315]